MTSKGCAPSRSNKQTQAFLWNSVHNIWSIHREPTSSCIILVMTSSQLLGNLKIIVYWQQLSICSFELVETLKGKTMPCSLKYTHWLMGNEYANGPCTNTSSCNPELRSIFFFCIDLIYFGYLLRWNLCSSIRCLPLLKWRFSTLYISQVNV